MPRPCAVSGSLTSTFVAPATGDCLDTSATKFDSIPTVEYMSGTQYYDPGTNADNVYHDDLTPNYKTGAVGGMCTELWTYDWIWAPGNACVKLEGWLWRYFSTGDVASDLVLGYQVYEAHAQAGHSVDIASGNSATRCMRPTLRQVTQSTLPRATH